jgi:hypothetical protein
VSRSLSRRLLLGTAPSAAVVAAVPATIGADSPDDELIRICNAHPALMDLCNSGTAAADDEDGPLWRAYDQSRDAITEAKPGTLEGLIAKARAAKHQARRKDGTEEPAGSMGEVWAWDLVNDLLRIGERGV